MSMELHNHVVSLNYMAAFQVGKMMYTQPDREIYMPDTVYELVIYVMDCYRLHMGYHPADIDTFWMSDITTVQTALTRVHSHSRTPWSTYASLLQHLTRSGLQEHAGDILRRVVSSIQRSSDGATLTYFDNLIDSLVARCRRLGIYVNSILDSALYCLPNAVMKEILCKYGADVTRAIRASTSPGLYALGLGRLDLLRTHNWSLATETWPQYLPVLDVMSVAALSDDRDVVLYAWGRTGHDYKPSGTLAACQYSRFTALMTLLELHPPGSPVLLVARSLYVVDLYQYHCASTARWAYALYIACCEGCADAVQRIMALHKSHMHTDEVRTALYHCSSRRVLDVMMSHMTLSVTDLVMIVMTAVEYGHDEVLRYLLLKDGVISALSDADYCAADLAIKKQNLSALYFLTKLGLKTTSDHYIDEMNKLINNIRT